ncbi:MAG: TonB-dependent receptor [Tannerella sp.]|jgi:TonB-linked SusC/RagA family outer membrane protein|nr:TonB-dependent receptor [Tannerella sp.]
MNGKKKNMEGIMPFGMAGRVSGRVRRTLLLLAAGLWSLTAVASDAKVSITLDNVRVEQALRAVARQTGLTLAYSRQVVNLDRRVSINVKDADVTQVLDELTRGTNLAYEIGDGKVYLFTKSAPAAPDATAPGQARKTVTGSVVDDGGEAIIGANIMEKGTVNGTVTDVDGRFSLTVADDALLQVSFIGYITQEVRILSGSGAPLTIKLLEDALALEEVVVVGYGTMKKSDLTGSVVSVNMNAKEMAANVNLSQALQGYVAGVNVGSASRAGEPGAISIRGQTSLSANDEPLIVVDGIIYNGSMTDIDVNDIEKIDILKDASAAAVYGSRSANGVIIISTKRGESDKPLFNFNAYYGMQDMAQTPRTKVMNGDQYALRLVDQNYYQYDLLPWYRTNPTSAEGRPARIDVNDRALVAQSLRSQEERDNYLAGREVNWMDLLSSAAPVQSYSLSVSGKTDRTNYYLSGTFISQDGIIDGDDFKRYTIRANFDNHITDWFTIGLNTALSRLDYSGYYNNEETVSADGFYNIAGMTYALRASPLANVTDANGNFPIYLANETVQRHPLVNRNIDDSDIANRAFLVLSAKIDVPFVQGLHYELNYSESFNSRNQNDFFPTTTFEGSSFNNYGTKILTSGRDWIVNNIVSYANTFNKVHSLSGTLLYSAEKRSEEKNILVAYGFQNPVLGYDALNLGETQSIRADKPGKTVWEEASISYMARVNYAYDSKYLLTGTYRRDGYSGFGSNRKYAGFPSVSAAWVLSRESWLENVGWLDHLKFRLSYGLNGNQGIGRYASLSKMESTAYVFGSNTAVGVYPNVMGNADLGWESTASTNAGIDFVAFDQRLSAEIDVYSSKTDDVLVERNIPRATGYEKVWTNIGGLSSRGIEATLTSVNVKSHDFRWQTKLLFALNRDEITGLYDGLDRDLSNSWFVGEPINTLYGYVVDGIWQESDLFSGNIMSGYYPGMYRLSDLNGDGSVDANNDRTILGYKSPNYRFGIDNTFNYRDFSLSFFINSIQGGNGYYMENVADLIIPCTDVDFARRANRPAIYDYWTPENPVNNVPAMYYLPPLRPGYYMSRSFVRLQDVSLAYNFRKSMLSRLNINNLQLYVSGKNLYIWTKWPGWDPEDDHTPQMRSVIGGVKLSF